jgi:hypothetical protein
MKRTRVRSFRLTEFVSHNFSASVRHPCLGEHEINCMYLLSKKNPRKSNEEVRDFV